MRATVATSLMPPPPEFTQTARAFEEQFDYVYRAMRRFGVSASDIEDLVQEVFLVMWRRWAEYQPDRPLRPWLAGIAFHIAQKHNSRGRREVPRGEVDREDESPQPEERLARARARELVLRALGALPPKQRVVLVMHEIDGVEMREIAATLQVPLFTAYSRLRRARLSFAAEVETLQRPRAALGGGVGVTADAAIAAERELEPAPPEARRRLRRQLRAVLAAPLVPASRPGGPPEAGARPGGPSDAGARAGSPSDTGARPGGVQAREPGATATAARPRPELSLRRASPRAPGVTARAGGTSAWSAGKAGWGVGLGAAALGLFLLTGALSSPAPSPASPVPGAAGAGRDARTTARSRGPQRAATYASVLPPQLVDAARSNGAASFRELGRGLSAYWRLDDGYGSPAARDVSAAGRDCRLHGLDPNGAWVAGAHGGALAVERGFLECPQPPRAVGSLAEMSASAWVRIDDWRFGHLAVVTRQVDAGDLDYFNLGILDGKAKVRSDFWNVRVTARKKLPVGRWVHLAFTFAGDGTLRLYQDGQEVGARQSPRKRRQALLEGPVSIGAAINAPDLGGLAQHFAGAVDEVALYDRALAGDEVAALAAGAQPPLSR